MGEETEHRQRIKLWMAGCLICVAILIDLIQFLLTLVAIGAILAPIITVGATFLFWLWYMLLGVSFITNPKRLATFAAESLGELIPVVDALPLWTIGTIATIMITRSEDKGGLLGKAAGMASPLMGKKGLIGASRQLAENPENLRPRFGNMRLAPKTIGNLRSGGYRHPEVLAPKTDFESKSGSYERPTSIPEKFIPEIAGSVASQPNNVLDLSRASIVPSASYQSPIESATVAAPIINNMEGINPTPNIQTEATSIIKVDENNLENIPTKDFLERYAFSRLGLDDESMTRQLSDASQEKREIIERSFKNSRETVRAYTEHYSEKGIVDQIAFDQADKEIKRDVFSEVYAKYSSRFSPESTGIQISEGEIAEILDSDDPIDQFRDLVISKSEEMAGRLYVPQVGANEDDVYRGKAAISQKLREEAGADKIRQEFVNLSITKRPYVADYRKKFTREELLENLQTEFDDVKSNHAVNINISWKNLIIALRDGGFKTADQLTPEQLQKISKEQSRNFSQAYFDTRNRIHSELGFTEGTQVVYGSLANKKGTEAQVGGASAYGDIFLEIEDSPDFAYTEGDSYTSNDSPSGMRKRDNVGFGFQDVKNRQVHGDHAYLSKAVDNIERDLVRRYEKISTHPFTYIEAQMPNLKLEQIKKINVPEKHAMTVMINLEKMVKDGDKWKEKINIIKS